MLVGQQIGPFQIESVLGSGAMGTVYRATFHRNEEKVITVALKVVALGLLGNEGAMARFEREANILKQLKHPCIVRLIAHGKINKANPYIAMEFIDGEALDRVLARRGKLGWEEVLQYGKQLAEALQYAHDKGIIHRDLKPSNLMITKDGVLKLADFGIAKDTDVTALTGANSTIGTAAYMSPEQCKGDRNLSNKSDLYSLGVVFFELLTGRKPFTAETTIEMFLKHVNERAPRIGKLVTDLPTKFESLILQLLEKDKDDRPVDASWIARMLAEVEEDAFARKSAGLVKAQARTLKPTNQGGDRMDATDREAARALRGQKKKKKKQVEQVPLLQKKWVQAVSSLVVLAAMGLGVYYAVKSPSPEKMYAAIDKAETPEAKLEAATRFLDAHGAKGGEQVDKAAVVFRDATVKSREKQLANRFNSSVQKMAVPTENDDPEAYRAAWAAMIAERDGNFEQAELLWAKVKSRFPEEAKLPYTTKADQLPKARWGWLADKRLADIAAAKGEIARLAKRLDAIRINDQAMKGDPASLESLAIRAMRLRAFGDHDRAGKVCESLIMLTESEADKHAWYLLGTQMKLNLNRAPEHPSAARLQRIEAHLKETEKRVNDVKDEPNRGAERREVRNRCRDITELYDDDDEPKVREAVKHARKLAALVPN